ncbi:hypothetical protein DK853_34635, partial [Klebsiella oxytoca]
ACRKAVCPRKRRQAALGRWGAYTPENVEPDRPYKPYYLGGYYLGIGGIGDFMDYVDIIEMGRHGAKYYVIYDLREDWGAHDSKGRF